MSTLIPPIQSVRDDMRRRGGVKPPRAPFGLTPGGGTQPGTLPARVAGAVGEQSRKAFADWERRKTKPQTSGVAAETQAQLGAIGYPAPVGEGGRPAPVGPEKQAAGAAEHTTASAVARERAPDAQPDVRAPEESTNTGAGGPRTLSLPEGRGSVTIHGDGPDPALQPGGFAYAGKMPARDRFASMPERGETEYGPESPTGGHSWTRTTPGRQRAQYEDVRYKREVQARQSQEDALIADLDARAAEASASMARSRELEEQPFAPEMAQAATAVGEQQARVRPEMMRTQAAMESFLRYRQVADAIDADPNLSPEEKDLRKREAEREAWMSIIAVQPSARKPREEFMFGAGTSEET